METSVSPNDTGPSIWHRAIRPELGDLPGPVARELLNFGLTARDLARVRELSSRANAGTLTLDETEELDLYLQIGKALEFIKAKARLSLGPAAAVDPLPSGA